MKHKLGHGEKRHECELCGERFTKIEQLKLHREQKHEKNKYVCGTCNKTIASRKRLWSHMSKDIENIFIIVILLRNLLYLF